MSNNTKSGNLKAILKGFLTNIKSLGTYSASDLSFWHPLVTPSEYSHQNLLQQYSEYNTYLDLYLKLSDEYKAEFSTQILEIYKELVFQKTFTNSILDRHLLYFVEFCFLIEKNEQHAKAISEILQEIIGKNRSDETFQLPVFSAVYLLISDMIGDIPDGFLKFVSDNLFHLPVFENSKNKLLFSNFISYAYDRGLIDDVKFVEMLEMFDFVPLSGTYSNFMQVVRLKFDIKTGSKSDMFLREYNLRLLESFPACLDNDFSINGKFKIHNYWRGRRIVLKTLDLFARHKNLQINIFKENRESTLWYIFRNLWHIENDPVEDTLTAADLRIYSENTLLSLAFMSPSFAGLVEEALEIPGLELLAQWNICHNNPDSLNSSSYPYIRQSQNLIINEISEKHCVAVDQHLIDKIEIGWFREILDIMGERQVKKLIKYFSLPFTEKRSKTREFAELLYSGRMRTKEDISKIIQKYPFYSNEDDIHDFLKSLINYMGEVLASSKSKILKVIPRIWIFLDNTAKFFLQPDIGYLLLPDHLNEFKTPKKQKMIIPTPGKRRDQEQITIKSAVTPDHRLKTVMWKRGRNIKRIDKTIKHSQQYRSVEHRVQFINAFADKLVRKYISRIAKNRYGELQFWSKLRGSGFESLMKALIFKTNDDFGLLDFDNDDLIMHTIDGEVKKLVETDVLHLCNPKQIIGSGKLESCAENIIAKQVIQPVEQVFCENFTDVDYSKTFDKWSKLEFSQMHFNEALQQRGWQVNTVGNICKTDDVSKFIAKIITKNQSDAPLNNVKNSLEDIVFFNVETHEQLKYKNIDNNLLMSVFADLHFAIACSSFTPLSYSFSSALQLFIVKYLENQGFSAVKFNKNKLSFVLPGSETTKSIQLDDINPLYFKESDENSWIYHPHVTSNFWKDGLDKLKAKILKIYPDFKA